MNGFSGTRRWVFKILNLIADARQRTASLFVINGRTIDDEKARGKEFD
jgi:hypothetical protein